MVPCRALIVVYVNNLARLLECRLVYYRLPGTSMQYTITTSIHSYIIERI